MSVWSISFHCSFLERINITATFNLSSGAIFLKLKPFTTFAHHKKTFQSSTTFVTTTKNICIQSLGLPEYEFCDDEESVLTIRIITLKIRKSQIWDSFSMLPIQHSTHNHQARSDSVWCGVCASIFNFIFFFSSIWLYIFRTILFSSILSGCVSALHIFLFVLLFFARPSFPFFSFHLNNNLAFHIPFASLAFLPFLFIDMKLWNYTFACHKFLRLSSSWLRLHSLY